MGLSLEDSLVSAGVPDMSDLEKPIGRVWRRLRFQRFLGALVWALGASLFIAAVAIAGEKLQWWPEIPGPVWAPLAIALGLGATIAGFAALLSGPNRLDAALAIDHSLKLGERLITALTLEDDVRDTAAGRAIQADALKHLKDADLATHFAIRLPNRSWLPIVPAALAAIALFAPARVLEALAAPNKKIEQPLDEKVSKQNAEKLKLAIAQKREKLDPRQAETAKLFAEIEKATEELAKQPLSKDQTLAKLNNLAEAAKDRRKELGTAEQIQKQLEMMKEMASDGPGDQFAKDLAKGDLKKALDEVKNLRDKLASGKMSEAEKKKLQNQLEDMKKQLKEMANLDQKRKELMDAKKKGSMSDDDFNKEMSKLDKQAENLEQLQKLSEMLGKAAESMRQGDTQKAAEELGMTQKELQEMAKNLEELESLDSALADIADAKNAMNGDGLNKLGEGLGELMGGSGRNQGNGDGQGMGQGRGDRPIAPDQTSAYNTKVKQQMTKGKGVIEGLGPKGMNSKGESIIDGQGVAEAIAGESADALTNQKIPNNHKKYIQSYFDRIKGE